MGKKKHAEHVNHERWLVSYADLLTLLFAFFVVLFASSVSDKKKTAQMAAAMQTAFTEHGVFDAHSTTPPLESGGGNSQGAPAPLMEPVQMAPGTSGPGSGTGTGSAAAARAIRQQVQKALAPALLSGSAALRQSADGLTISLHEAGFFESGTADINPAMTALLTQIAATLPDRDLRIEGHTDNLPVHNNRYRSNFELSTARAAAIGEVLMSHSHIPPSRFSLAGYGPFRPVTGNDTAQGRAQNRRVDIVLLGTGPSVQTGPHADLPDKRATSQLAAGANTSLTAQSNATGFLPALPPRNGTGTQPHTAGGPRVLQLATDADRLAAKGGAH